MQYKPHRYQEFAKEHIIRHAVAALFLDMGGSAGYMACGNP